ncbi:zeatin O-glucosyltransferase-like [Lycium barbarum]|uniref:zeatin O-glucosyltransferase-like n=1 Tax=Lycium barbarum TaxID=112863 RepID=UPI00293F15F7|nr:zeatin O-glucosyltransferase-like [Lycium barbarum]
MTAHSSNNQIIVAIIPWPEHGHLNQLFHIANFISSHNIPLHFISLTNKNQELKNRAQNSLNSSKIHFNDLLTPSITQNSQPQNVNFADEYAFLEFLDKLGDPICKICVEIAKKAKKLVVVFDSLMTDVIKDVYLISNVECYSFHAISGFTMYSTFRQVVDDQDHDEVARQVFDEMPQRENCIEKGVFDHDEVARKVFDEMPQRENCPGPGIFDRDKVARQVFDELPQVEDCFGPDIFEFVKKERECNLNTGEFMNSCRELEGKYLDVLASVRKKPLFALGPFHMLQEFSPESSSNGYRHECLEFLDKQDANSVMFVSFGTTTTLSQEQVNELALGLEKSNHKFIWVLREADKKMDTEECEGRKDGNFELPEGFEERVEGRGMVVRNWVPQLEILGHKSTGGFLSHCGWNSCMESISMGVPIATWPIHVDQPYNAVFVTNVLKIGIPVKSWARREELVTAMAVEKAVKSLMGTLEGEEMRQRAIELSNKIKNSVSHGGLAHKERESFISCITK